MTPGQLKLASGETFSGLTAEWQDDTVSGEIVFNTGMVGYTESMTDPSYYGQILTFTYPLIGNYGVCDPEYWESKSIQVSAIITSHIADFNARDKNKFPLFEFCRKNKIPFLTGVDTRALTKCLRSKGVIAGAICKKEPPKAFVDVNKNHLVAAVSPQKITDHGTGEKQIIAVDCGMKENIFRKLSSFPIKIKRVPFDYDFSEEEYDGVFISNGPGDPARCTETIDIIKKVIKKDKPMFGICLGSQLIAHAIGADTYKLPFGHRSQNQPCLETATERCVLTSQNHGYAVKAKSLPKDWRVSFINLNDDTVQGIEHKTKPIFAVQFHPEAAPGPVDTHYLFEKFYQSL